jgi:hypothetical protein
MPLYLILAFARREPPLISWTAAREQEEAAAVEGIRVWRQHLASGVVSKHH